MISTEKKKKINERCKALEKEFERRYKKETEVRGKKCFSVREDDRIRTRILKNRSGKKHV